MPKTAHPMRPASAALAAGFILVSLIGGCTDRQVPSPSTTQPVTGADTVQASPAPATLSSASQSSASKPTVTLILTWMNADQPPQTTQTVFHDQASCAQARDAAIAEGRRLALEALATPTAAPEKTAPVVSRRYVGTALLPADSAPGSPAAPASASPIAPKVAAICVAA